MPLTFWTLLIFYTIYKTTCLVTGKFYIGQHRTKRLDDGYLGSGKMLLLAIQKYGAENFTKEILEIYDNERQMNLAEKILVVVDKDISYNLNSGGQKPWIKTQSHDEASRKNFIKAQEKQAELFKDKNSEFYKKHQQRVSKQFKGKQYWLGKTHTLESKMKLSDAARLRKGSKNSQFGSMWITDGVQNKKIKKINVIPEGWYKGRKFVRVA